MSPVLKLVMKSERGRPNIWRIKSKYLCIPCIVLSSLECFIFPLYSLDSIQVKTYLRTAFFLNVKYRACPHGGAATPLKFSRTKRIRQRLCLNGACALPLPFMTAVMGAVIMLSFILSRTLCQTVAQATCKSPPTLVTTLRTFTASGSRCGEDSGGGKILI